IQWGAGRDELLYLVNRSSVKELRSVTLADNKARLIESEVSSAALSPNGLLLIMKCADHLVLSDERNGNRHQISGVQLNSHLRDLCWNDASSMFAWYTRDDEQQSFEERFSGLSKDSDVIDVAEWSKGSPRSASIITWYDVHTGLNDSVRVEGRCRSLRWTPWNTLLIRTYKLDYPESDAVTHILEIDPLSKCVSSLVSAPGYMQSMIPKVSPDGTKIALSYDVDA